MKNMMLVCFGAGEKSRYVRKLLETNTDMHIQYYVENQAFDKIGTVFDGLEVISIYALKKQYENGEITGIVITSAYHRRTLLEIIKSCTKIGIKDEDIYLMRHNTIRSGAPEDGRWIVPYKECVQIFNLSIHIVDHCNMNCELCSHNSQLVDGEVFVDYNKFCRDMDRLHELVPDIQEIALLGGEPLLHPDIQAFVEYSKKKYPYSDVSIYTNGILLRSSSEPLLESLRENDVRLMISLYPPMHEQLDNLVEYIRENRLKASFNRVEQFTKMYHDAPIYDSKEMSSDCGYCMGLRNGRICRCVQGMYTDYFNKRFGDTFPEEKGFDLYDENLDPLQLIHDLEKPMELCRYCAIKYSALNAVEWRQISADTRKEDICYHEKRAELRGTPGC